MSSSTVMKRLARATARAIAGNIMIIHPDASGNYALIP
jgi:hypothetical protein